MNILNNIKVGKKIVGSFVVIAVLLVVVAVSSFFSMKNINDGMTTMYANRLVPISLLGQADSVFTKLRGDVLKYIMFPNERTVIEQEIKAQVAEVEKYKNGFNSKDLTPAEKSEAEHLEILWADYNKELADVLVKSKAGNQIEALKMMALGGSFSNARQRVEVSIGKLIELNVKMADTTHKQGDDIFAGATIFMAVTSVVVLILALVTGLVLTRSIANPLAAITRVAQQVASGDLSADVLTEQRRDEIGVLAKAFREMLENLRSTTMDLSEGKRLEAELHTASVYARSLLEASLDPLVTISADGKITDVNSTAEQVTGVTRERLIGSDFSDYFTDPEKAKTGYKLVFSQGSVKDYPLTIRHATGRTTDVLYNSRVYRDEAGDVQGVFAAARDVTESKRLEKQLQDQDWMKTGIVRLGEVMSGDPDLTTIANRAISEISTYLGAQVGVMYMVQEGTGDSLSLMGSYAYSKRKNLSNVFKLGEGLVGQAALEKKQILIRNVPDDYVKVISGLGERVPRYICVTPFLFEGNTKGVVEIGTLNEMTDREMEYLNQVMPALAMSVQSSEGRSVVARLLSGSQALSEELQSQQEELRVSNEELQEQTNSLIVSEEALKVQQEELRVTNEELLESNTLLDRQKRDVEKARSNIETQATELALASKYKSEFLANMSHELRTPLNSLLLLSQSLSDNKPGNLTGEQVECATIIHNSGNDLLNLINEILDLSKIEAGRMDLQLGSVRLSDLADSIRDSFGHMTENKGLTLEVALHEDVPSEIRSDQKRIEQILKNLISNAIKFTDLGSVTVSFARPSEGTNLLTSGLTADKCLAIVVRDTGIGIDSENQKIIFEAFQQIDGGTARKYGGTGLGLSISRELARLLGGEIQIESQPGKGSVFTLYLPVEAPVGRGNSSKATHTVFRADERIASKPARSVAGVEQIEDDRDNLVKDDRLILVIEDDPSFARILYRKCHDKGFKCLAAPTGEEGLELARKHQPGAIILDINLPGMDGWAVLGALKENTNTRHIPVHIASVDGTPSEAFRRGAVGLVNKPLSQEDLEETFRRLERISPGKLKRILVIDDDPVLRRETVRLLGDKDVKVDEAETGLQALEALRSGGYDCIVLDLRLPDMDGDELLKTLEREGVDLPPVVVYTGQDLTPDQESDLREHTEAVVIKDVRSQERLLDEVSLFLHRVVSEMPRKKQQIIIDLHDTDALLREKKVLIVDDDMRTTFALSRLLSEHGMKAEKAENGMRALKLLEEQPDVDIVLMDIMMPTMDGYEAMKLIRKQEKFRKLPIIALTAKAMPEDRQKCLAAGANDYLQKPVDQERLFSMMRVWLYR